MTVRFFDYDPTISAYRYIVLSPENPKVEAFTSGEHEEGWSSTAVTWELDGDVVRCTVYTDGRDCDGRMSSCDVSVCSIGCLADRVPYCAEGEKAHPFKVPEWTDEKSSRRDYSAEAAGY